MHTVIDLFCGAGGLSEGFRQAGFNVLGGNDCFEAAGNTFTQTHPEALFLSAPIQRIEASDFLNGIGINKGDLDCLIGGPPCQAYSVYNHDRGTHDDRANLFKEYLRLVEGLQPKFLVIENVTGIFSIDKGAIVKKIVHGLKGLGYSTDFKILKSEEYGVPQERRRVLFIANRLGKNNAFPTPQYGAGKKEFVTVFDAISDLPKLNNGEECKVSSYPCAALSEYQVEMRKGSNRVQNHSAPKLGQINLDRIKHIPPGGSWRDIPFDLLPNGMKKAKRSDHTKRYGRMQWDGLSSTILTKCDIHWGAYIHPEQNRAISVREAARLQSFPDWFVFQGSKTEQYIQVGNAVPPILGREIGKTLLKTLSKDTHHKSLKLELAL